ncbi:MAG TPA: BrnT family toxin [Gammaproteobacteria bacterium]|nr:BrnT family toxin [Gammaproteobacteria bacterium]
MRITFDPAKRDITLAERGLDFADAALVFSGVTLEVEDIRRNYGETRIICYGLLGGRMVVVGYTPRGADRHVFSMRKANEREQTRIAPLLEV